MAATRQHPALEETLGELRDLVDQAQVLAEQGQQAALTHNLLKMGRTLYSAISLTEISPNGDFLDLRNPSS